MRLLRFGLNPAENEKNDDDDKDQPDAAGRGITPIATMRPPWQCSEKSQNQDHDQYSSKHVLLLVIGLQPCKTALGLRD